MAQTRKKPPIVAATSNDYAAEVERRKDMADMALALEANTKAVQSLEKRFDVFEEQAKQRQKSIEVNCMDIERHEIAIKGNGKPGMEGRLSRLEIYASIIVGLMSTGVIGVIGYIIVKGVELVYTHNVTP